MKPSFFELELAKVLTDGPVGNEHFKVARSIANSEILNAKYAAIWDIAMEEVAKKNPGIRLGLPRNPYRS